MKETKIILPSLTAGIFIFLFTISVNSQSWSGLGSGMNNLVKALTIYNGNLIAAGDFRTAGG
jgi:hypothetical protein